MPNDADTLLLSRFENSTTGEAGEVPTLSTSATYGTGLVGQGIDLVAAPARLSYATANNISAAAGTIEFVMKPSVAGSSGLQRTLFEVGDNFNRGILIAIDGANNLRLIEWGDDPATAAVESNVERGVGFNVSGWTVNDWHHVVGTWDVPTHTLALYVDGALVGSNTNGAVNASFSSSVFSVGTETNGANYARARLDEFRISSRVRTPDEIRAAYEALFGVGVVAPTRQRAVANNGSVSLKWTPVVTLASLFDHYAIYRSTSPITSNTGLTPIGTVASQTGTTFVDSAVTNGATYYYAIASVGSDGTIALPTVSDAPGARTPRSETDLQVVSVARSPLFERYLPIYTSRTVTEPSGFGPYITTAATGLANGQTASTQRWPNIGDSVTYTATIRNRGTNNYTANVSTSWNVDGSPVRSATVFISLAPGATATVTYARPWDNQSHTVDFAMTPPGDARAANNTLRTDTRAVPFMTYIDQSFLEDFRDAWSPLYAARQTDDLIDWLNRHMDRFNEIFQIGGTRRRVSYGVLQVIDDLAPTPATPSSTYYGVFPLRYRSKVDGNPRTVTGAMDATRDIDNALMHEMGHQLGLIDVYSLDVPADWNDVSGLPHTAVEDLMRTTTPIISEFSAGAMEDWLDDAPGFFGQYTYNMPTTLRLRLLSRAGTPLAGATVQAFQYANRPGLGPRLTTQVKFTVTSDANGIITMPNVPIDPALVPALPTGDQLHDNPFGYLDGGGSNGVLHFKVQLNGETDYAWFDVSEANVAFWRGQTQTATFDRMLSLGGPLQPSPPTDMTEENAAEWTPWAQGGTASIVADTVRKRFGDSSLHLTTDGGFDVSMTYPGLSNAQWNLTDATTLRASLFAVNSTHFDNGSPWFILRDLQGNTARYDYFKNGSQFNLLDGTRGQWIDLAVPLNPGTPPTGWHRSMTGNFDWTKVHSLEIHADTNGYGFELWSDGVGFDLPVTVDAAQYDFDAATPSIRLDLNADVEASLLLNDIQVRRVGDSADLATTGMSLQYNRATDLATLAFPGFAGSVLPDGNYRLTLAATSVEDAFGNTLRTPYTFDFFVLAGDLNRDRVVNFADLVTLAQNYNKTGKSFSQGNVDYSADGAITFADLVVLAQRYNHSVALPAASLSSPVGSKTKPRTSVATNVIV